GCLVDADAVVVEALQVGTAELASAARLRLVQKYGVVTRNIDLAACNTRRVGVLTLRRRANIACAEHIFALMLALARKLPSVGGQSGTSAWSTCWSRAIGSCPSCLAAPRPSVYWARPSFGA